MRNALLLFCPVFLFSSTLAAQDWARKILDDSPRHHEWVAVRYGDREVQSFLAFPEASKKVPSVVLIHENRGLTDWVRIVADQLAAAGYVAIAPDLLSGMGPGGGKTSDFPDTDAAREALYNLPPDQVTADLKAVADYVSALAAANGTVAVGGFCWGGSQTFRFAASGAEIAAAYVFYGTGPDSKEVIAKIKCPVYGFYGGNDARVNATVPTSEKLMAEAAKSYEPAYYEEAGHAFMRRGDEPDAAGPNKIARDQAWKRWKRLLAQLK